MYKTEDEHAFYCKDCNKIYNVCYELDNIFMCPVCWSEELKLLTEQEIKPFIRNKRLKRLNDISKLGNIE